MQRLYSVFPSGVPGAGLLLLRLTAGGLLIAERISRALAFAPTALWAANLLLVITAVCMGIGLWTPVVGAIAGMAELSMLFSRSGGYQHHLLLAVLSVGLAMLGPGAWSIDAQVFGRKRITL